MLIYKFYHKKYRGYRLVDLSDPLEEGRLQGKQNIVASYAI